MHTARFLFALMAFAAATVHGGDTKEPVTQEPSKEPDTDEPTKPTEPPFTPKSKDPVTPTPPPTPPNSTCTVIENKDRPGFDLDTSYGPLASCQIACNRTRFCETWTWSNYEGGTCWLKTYGAELVDKKGVYTTNCVRNGCGYLPNRDRLGYDLVSVRGPLDSCFATCKTTRDCVTFSWSEYNGGTCWLKANSARFIDKPGVTAYSCIINTATDSCRVFRDIDFGNLDIGTGQSTDGVCCDLCNEFPGCTAYTWTDFNGGTCWFKKSVGQVIAKPGAISASTNALYGPLCPFEYDIDFVGNDIGNKPAKDAGICCDLCKGNEECKAYSWNNYNGGTCWMKSGKTKTVAAPGVISAALTDF